MLFKLEENIADKYIKYLIENNDELKNSNIIDTGISKIINNTEIAYKTNEFGIPILPTDWKEEDDDDYPTLNLNQVLNVIKGINHE